MYRIRCWVFLIIAGLVPAAAGVSLAGDWPNWRGPNHDGRSTEKKFKKSWDGDLPIAWQMEIGDGYSGISRAKGRVYACGTGDSQQMLYCLKAKNGELLWKSAIESNYKNNFGDGPRSTPTVDGDRVYILGATGTVACFDCKNGSEVWSKRYSRVPQWGYSGSVLIEGDLAIVTTGGSDGGLRALNKETGEEVWKQGSDDESGYSTPYPFEMGGTRYIVGFLGRSVVIAEASTGKEVLSMDWVTDWNVNAATPIFHEGHLFLSSGYKTGCALFKLGKKDDRLNAEEVWRSKVLLNKFQTPVLYKGKLYSYDEKSFKCVDFMTGKREWRKRGKHGTVVIADGYLIALGPKGKLQIGKASPDGFEPTGESQILDGKCWTVPTLSKGRLYARNYLGRIVCVDLKD